MKPVTRYLGSFRWEDVATREYKPEGEHFRDLTRQVLFGPEAGLACELRYFEIEPDGHSTLERHEHAHAVLVLQGAGRVLVGSEIHDIVPYDLVRVPAMTWHQFRAERDAPLGFLCLVDAERDRPTRPTADDLRTLRSDPGVAAFIRA